jgi:transmembrane sensor
MQKDLAWFKNVLPGFIDNRLSPGQVEELIDFMEKNPEATRQILNSREIKDYLQSKAYNEDFNISDLVSSRMRARLMSAVNETELQDEKVAPVHKMNPGRSFRWTAAAAAVLLTIGITYFVRNRTQEKPSIAAVQNKEDVSAPSAIRATITLANGQKIVLDSSASGMLATQGNVQLIKNANGRVEYNEKAKPVSGSPISYNTLSNPRGSKVVALTLSDGTRVWLNSESSLTYPTAFAGKERKVSMTGEAYFEVVHNAGQPFRIEAKGVELEDIGTSFNINAYPEEPASRTTVISGSVKVKTVDIPKQQSFVLTPDQAAVLTNGDLHKEDKVDGEASIAWKNDLFTFEDQDLKTILRQVSRWYDVDLEYKTEPGEKPFSGGLSRQLTLKQLLILFNGTGLHFELHNKTLTISK